MNKTIVLGLDGVDFEILKCFRDSLPNINKILEEGSSGELVSTIPPTSPTAWSSFATGCNPGKHGIYSFKKFDGFQDTRLVDSRDIKKKTFYEILRESEINSILIGLLLSFPPRTDDIIIPSFIAKTEEIIFPAETRKELKTEKERFKKGINRLNRGSSIINESINFMEAREDLINKLIGRKDWELFFRHFPVTDWIQHIYLHKFQDPHFKEKVSRVYEKIDQQIGNYLELEDTNLILMSDHGFKTYEKIFYINTWLEDRGMLEKSKTHDERWPEDPLLISLIKKVLRAPIIRDVSYYFLNKFWKLFKVNTDTKVRAESFLTYQPDFKNSRAFCPDNLMYGIYLNDNLIPENKKLEIERKIQDLLEKSELVERTFRKGEIYEGDEISKAPDIILNCDNAWVSDNLSRRIKRKTVKNYHQREGFFAAIGPDFREGIRQKVSILDLAPTILSLFGVDAPEYIDGEVLTKYLKE